MPQCPSALIFCLQLRMMCLALRNELGDIKNVVVDLDDTMGGIIGDMYQNIEIGDLGIGKVYKEFQSWLKSLKKGILAM